MNDTDLNPRPPAEQLRLDGRIVVVAGAGGGGIGTATCVALAMCGATVIGLDNSDAGRAVAAEHLTGADAQFDVLDVDAGDPGQVDTALADVEARHGAVDGLVNVVGGMRGHHWGRLDTMPEYALDELVRSNLMAPITTSRVLASRLPSAWPTASIVNIASAAGLASMPYGALYGATKAALVNVTRTMAVEWGPDGIRVNAVAPGTITTAKIRRERFDGDDPSDEGDAAAHVLPLRRRGRPDEVAGLVTFLLSDLASYISGHTLVVDGGMLARPAYADEDDLPAFVRDTELRARLRGAEQ